ncbi:MAG: acyl-CoA thioesterase [Planctomycetes bacterium]|nr:acyl-CoA thioesterase [Planctomycetota bacterium]
MEINIYYADTDCGGVVYYANYLKYFEYGRTEYMRQRGLDPSELTKSGIVFTVVTADVVYHAPSRYGDTIIVDTYIVETSRASFTFGYKVHNN